MVKPIGPGPRLVVTVNCDTVRIARRHRQLRATLLRAVAVPDGWPVARYLRRALRRSFSRITGADLVAWLLEGRAGPINAIVVGADAECHTRLRRRLSESPRVRVLGYFSPNREELRGTSGIAGGADQVAREERSP